MGFVFYTLLFLVKYSIPFCLCTPYNTLGCNYMCVNLLLRNQNCKNILLQYYSRYLFHLVLQIYIFYLLVFSLATLYIIIYIVISYCRNKPVKIRGVELAFAPYICLAFIIIYNFNFIERIIERIL